MTNPVPYVKALQPATGNVKPSIGRLLLDAGILKPADIERILLLQRALPLRFGEAAQKLGVVNASDVQRALAQQFDYCYLVPGEGGLASELTAAFHPFSTEMEEIRTLRGRLLRNWFNNGRRELSVAAVNHGDGASLLVANLAVAFAQQGLRTLLVDANLRRPRQQSIFNLRRRQGLTDMLAERAGPDTVVTLDVIPSLSILCAGTPAPNPQELLNRRAFIALREPMRAYYDIILYDTPAFADADDAFCVAARSGVLVVARKHQTTVSDLRSLAQQLYASGIEVAGSVLNEF
jgi:protein-tyrosine kinase